MSRIQPPQALRDHPKKTVWFYKPSWRFEPRWFNWSDLLPVSFGHDEYSRETVLLGWQFTGRAVIAFRYCGDEECYEQSIKWIDEEES